MSLFGQVINNTGFWTLIDSYAFPASRTRDAIYFSVGVVLVWMNAVFLVNAGIVPGMYVCVCLCEWALGLLMFAFLFDPHTLSR